MMRDWRFTGMMIKAAPGQRVIVGKDGQIMTLTDEELAAVVAAMFGLDGLSGYELAYAVQRLAFDNRPEVQDIEEQGRWN